MYLTAYGTRTNPRERLLEAFQRRGGILTRRDIAGLGIGSKAIRQLLEAGEIVRAAHGLYRLAEVSPFGTAAFAQACLAIPSGVIALESALSYYALTTQIVATVEIAVPRKVPRKKIEIPLQIVSMPLSRFAWQIDRVRSPEGNRFRIFSSERTVCDCFAYPNLVPENIAYEGLKSYLEHPSAKISALMEQAKFTDTLRFIDPVIKTMSA